MHFSGIGTLIDVGGGTGNLLTTVLQRHPAVRGLLYDLPHVAAEARQAIAAKELADRCEVKEAFFEAVLSGGDAYMLSHIIHDWDEQECLTILRNCRRAMSRDARLLLVEMVVPPGNDFHPSKFLDLVMLTVPGGQERTAQGKSAPCETGFTLTNVSAHRIAGQRCRRPAGVVAGRSSETLRDYVVIRIGR